MPSQLEWLGGCQLGEAVEASAAKLFRQEECEVTVMLNISQLSLCSPTPLSLCVCVQYFLVR